MDERVLHRWLVLNLRENKNHWVDSQFLIQPWSHLLDRLHIQSLSLLTVELKCIYESRHAPTPAPEDKLLWTRYGFLIPLGQWLAGEDKCLALAMRHSWKSSQHHYWCSWYEGRDLLTWPFDPWLFCLLSSPTTGKQPQWCHHKTISHHTNDGRAEGKAPERLITSTAPRLKPLPPGFICEKNRHRLSLCARIFLLHAAICTHNQHTIQSWWLNDQ